MAIKGSGTLPGGIVDGNYYYLIASPGSNIFKLATTPQNARAGIAINITSLGFGTCSFRMSANNSQSIRPRVDINNNQVINCSVDGYSLAALSINAIDGNIVNGFVFKNATDDTRVGVQQKHHNTDDGRLNIFTNLTGINCGVGVYAQDSSEGMWSNITLVNPQGHGALLINAPGCKIENMIIYGLKSDKRAIYINNAADCSVTNVQSTIAAGATNTTLVYLNNADRAVITGVKAINDHTVGVYISSTSVFVSLGLDVKIRNSMLIDMSNTTIYPLVYETPVDFSSTGALQVAIPPNGIIIGRVAVGVYVSPSSGTPKLSFGIIGNGQYFLPSSDMPGTTLGVTYIMGKANDDVIPLANSTGTPTNLLTVTVNSAATGGRATFYGLPLN